MCVKVCRCVGACVCVCVIVSVRAGSTGLRVRRLEGGGRQKRERQQVRATEGFLESEKEKCRFMAF